ncbi:MAG: nitroreductase family deazaflavin-dependent oxidoreductase [Chloroflexi bacterium]|nr:nitroreductase family deazaflavin-dependent oxidoreductase [Chloroflexota bacterium]
MTPQAEKLLTEATELDLTTTGRTSGEPRTVELWFAYDEGYVYFLTGDTHWGRNLEAHPEATLRIKRRRFNARLEPVAEAEGASVKAHIIALFRVKYGDETVGQWYAGREHTPIKLRVLS